MEVNAMADVNEKKKILLVDDDETHLLIAQSMLKYDYETIVAKSGTEALDFCIKGVYPNLVLLDILMPSMDGWETYHQLKGISLLKDIPIAFLTSENNAMEEKRAYEMGAVDYITKPYDKSNLLKRIQRILHNAENPPDSEFDNI
jgi:putative two-component system response regulator